MCVTSVTTNGTLQYIYKAYQTLFCDRYLITLHISLSPSEECRAAPISLLRPYLSPYTNFQLHKELVVLLKPQQNVGAQQTFK